MAHKTPKSTPAAPHHLKLSYFLGLYEKFKESNPSGGDEKFPFRHTLTVVHVSLGRKLAEYEFNCEFIHIDDAGIHLFGYHHGYNSSMYIDPKEIKEVRALIPDNL